MPGAFPCGGEKMSGRAPFRSKRKVSRGNMHGDSGNRTPIVVYRPIVTAVFVDGGFYTKRANELFGKKTPKQRAEELKLYCHRHIQKSQSSLYRIFYYDCPPSDKRIYHPLHKGGVNLAKSNLYAWSNEFHQELLKKRKVAFRRGEILAHQNGFMIKPESIKELFSGKKRLEDLTEFDFFLDIKQKGVDMRLGLDIASVSQGGIVNQIIMIAGDSDFVPAAKTARKAGVDFILDPMWQEGISNSLLEHIDGVRHCVNKYPDCLQDPLHVNNLTEEVFKDLE